VTVCFVLFWYSMVGSVWAGLARVSIAMLSLASSVKVFIFVLS
jgi:hypothetical protein